MAIKSAEKRTIMRKVLSCFVVFAILMSAVFIFVTQSNAVMLVDSYMGKVTEKNNNVLTVQIEYKPDYSNWPPKWVSYSATSQWTISNSNAINEIRGGDYIEIAGFLGVDNEGESVCIGKMKSSTEKVITDVYGDLDYLLPNPQLLGNYIIEYENTPDCSKYQGIEISGCNVEAKYSDVTIHKENRQLKSQRLYPSQNYGYEDKEYKVDITFNSGGAPAYPDCTDQPCFGPQAFSDFTIHIKKIEEKKPDLIIQDIYWSPSNPKKGDIITFTIKVKNQGDGDAGECEAWSSIVVGSDVSICDFTFTVPSLTAGEEFTYTNSCKATKCGEFYVAATVDFWDAVEESNDNNYIEKPISISCIEKPDLVIQKISWSPSNPKHGDAVKINVNTKNQGSGSAGGFYVCYYVDGSYYARDYISGLSAGSTTTTSFSWTADCGSHSIKAVADCYSDVEESNEGNNGRTEYINIVCEPDLVVQDIYWSPSSPKQGDTVTINVKTKNQGSENAGGFYVCYYVDGSYYDRDYVSSLSAGSTTTTSFTWTADCGSHSIKAVADCYSDVEESNEGNNDRTEYINIVCKPDLIIQDIFWSPSNPKQGDTVTVNVKTKNQGSENAGGFYVCYYVDGSYYARNYVSSLSAGSTTTTSFSWTADCGSHS